METTWRFWESMLGIQLTQFGRGIPIAQVKDVVGYKASLNHSAVVPSACFSDFVRGESYRRARQAQKEDLPESSA